MKTVIAQILILLGVLTLTGPGWSAPRWQHVPPPPPESLAGIVPGVSTVSDTMQRHGPYDVVLPGSVTYIYAGYPASHEYQWSIGNVLGRRAFSVETEIGGGLVNLVIVDRYPGLLTSRGLGTLMPEQSAWLAYGMPDYAYEWHIPGNPTRELFYLEQGLVVVLQQIPGRSGWAITKLVLTYPAYLNNAVALRTREAMRTHYVREITRSYRVWARMAVPSTG